MLPIRVLGLVVVVFFAIAIGPALIKVPERTEAIAKISAANVADWSNEDASELETPGANFAIVPAKELESASIPVEQGEVPTASEIAEGPSAKSLPPTSYGALSSEVDAAQVDSYDLTGSVRSGAQAPRKVQKPNLESGAQPGKKRPPIQAGGARTRTSRWSCLRQISQTAATDIWMDMKRRVLKNPVSYRIFVSKSEPVSFSEVRYEKKLARELSSLIMSYGPR